MIIPIGRHVVERVVMVKSIEHENVLGEYAHLFHLKIWSNTIIVTMDHVSNN